MNEIKNCPYCDSKNLIRKGQRKTRFGYRQSYYCKNCRKKFIGSKLENKTYGPKIITNAISYYNIGNTLTESAKLVNKRFKVHISRSSVHQWLKEVKDICTYYKLRQKNPRRFNGKILLSPLFIL